jgi:hypothetical protein
MERLKRNTPFFLKSIVMVLLVVFSLATFHASLRTTFKYNESTVVVDFNSDQENKDTETEFGEEDFDYFFHSVTPIKFISIIIGKLNIYNYSMLPTIFYDTALLPPEL